MSETVRYKGKIKEIHPEIESVREKITKLAEELDVPVKELIGHYGEGELKDSDFNYLDTSSHLLSGGRVFYVGDLDPEYDPEEDHFHAEDLGGGEFEIDVQFYNGGCDLSDAVGEAFSSLEGKKGKVKEYKQVISLGDYDEETGVELKDGDETVFEAWNLDDCPEDAILGRNLFDDYDYVKALNKGIELAGQGYTKVVIKQGETNE